MNQLTELSQYSECVNPCPECPIADQGDAEKVAVNAMCAIFGLDSRLSWGGMVAMHNTAEVVISLAGGNPDNADAVVAATDKILNRQGCSTSRWHKGA